ncbi:MAG: type II secretion system F family protein [Candidatus Omnitrophota bacterium]
MAKFIYTVISKDGRKQTNRAEAESEELLLNKLQAEGVTVVSIREEVLSEGKIATEMQARARPSPKVGLSQHSGVKSSDLVIFARQLATMLSAGVNLLRCLEIISLQVTSRKLQSALETIKKDVSSGRNLSDSLAEHPKIFSKFWINLVTAGEASGSLPVVLDKLAFYLEAREAFKTKLISAMIYPLLLLVVALLANFAFLFFIVPRFYEIFSTFNIKLPLVTRILLSLSIFLRRGIIYIILGCIGLFFGLKNFISTGAGKRLFDKQQLQIPLLKGMIQAILMERFASQISMLLESGVPILYALEITQHGMGNVLMEDAVEHVKESVRQGKTFHAPLEESGLFPPMVTQMVAIGEEIGELPKMCNRIANYYQQYVETFIARLTSIFEPVMIVFMGLLIGAMVIAMYWPIFKLSTGGGGFGG